MMLAAGAGGAGQALSPALRAVCASVGTAAVLALLLWAVVVRRAEWGAFFLCVAAAALAGYAAWFPDVFMHSLVWMGQQWAPGRRA